MEEANTYIFQINILLRNIKSVLRAEFIYSCPGGIAINTNNVLNPSNLTTMKQYLKLINSAGNNKILALYLFQSKSYLKITSISYIQPNGNKLTSDDITNIMKHLELFEYMTFVTKPRIIKAFPKSDIAIIWFDIWDSQNDFKAKLLINHSFNFGRSIATIRTTNINPRVSQCHNYWKWDHSIFSYCAHGSKCQKCNRPHKLEYHRDLAWYCKTNSKLNPPRLETAQDKPYLYTFKCVNCKGKHIADDNKYPF